MPTPDDALSSPAASSSLPLPPTLTPATTTRHSVALAVLSTIWTNDNTTTAAPEQHPIPAIVTNAPSPASDTPNHFSTPSLAVLPAPQSAALRALNAPAFQQSPKPAKSTSSQTTLSSQPVVVRTYSGARHTSRPSSGINTPRLFPAMNGSTSQNNPTSHPTSTTQPPHHLPAIDDFSFTAILRAVDPEIRDAIDAIAEICARSRLSLADEYDAHLPPQGEIVNAGGRWGIGMGALVGRGGRMQRVGQGWSSGGENALMAVPEASSSSERLAGSVNGSVKDKRAKRSRSAYGSLKSVFSAEGGGRATVDSNAIENKKEDTAKNEQYWAVRNSSSTHHPSITLITTPTPSKYLSLDISSPIPSTCIQDQDLDREIKHQHSDTTLVEEPGPSPLHRRHTSPSSVPHSSRPLASLAAWIPWARSSVGVEEVGDATRAEVRLKEMLRAAKGGGEGKGKGVVR